MWGGDAVHRHQPACRHRSSDTSPLGNPVRTQRYEDGTPNTAGVFGLLAALELILEFGLEAIAARVLELSKRVRDGARGRGVPVACAAEGAEASGIVSFPLQAVLSAPEWLTRPLRR